MVTAAMENHVASPTTTASVRLVHMDITQADRILALLSSRCTTPSDENVAAESASFSIPSDAIPSNIEMMLNYQPFDKSSAYSSRQDQC